jgi:hypothetical protein
LFAGGIGFQPMGLLILRLEVAATSRVFKPALSF